MKKNNIYIILISLLQLLLFPGCITEYEPTGIEEVSDLLIVDGTISSGESVITLRRSVGLTESLTGGEGISNATMYVESNDGNIIGYADHKGDGEYIIPTGTLRADKEYRLRISVSGLEYESTFLSPLFTPEIDSLAVVKKGEGQTVYMVVSTHDPLNQSRFYRWSYKEHWEMKTELFANAGLEQDEYGNDIVVYYTLSSSNNYYYCWGKDHSRILLLESADKLTENKITQKALVGWEPSNRRLSMLYYISVSQMMLHKEAYDYFYNLQKNIEQTGSIFSPIPSEMKGNIKCITNPDLPVVGYIDVTTITEKDMFVPEKAGYYEPPVLLCESQIQNDPAFFYPPVYAFYEYYGPYETLFAPHRCVNCTKLDFGTKNKPDFWPTDHL